MSAPASNAQKMIKRYGKMAEGYQQRIDTQRATIDRMLKGLTLAQECLSQIGDAESLEDAKTMATNGGMMINVALQKEADAV